MRSARRSFIKRRAAERRDFSTLHSVGTLNLTSKLSIKCQSHATDGVIEGCSNHTCTFIPVPEIIDVSYEVLGEITFKDAQNALE